MEKQLGLEACSEAIKEKWMKTKYRLYHKPALVKEAPADFMLPSKNDLIPEDFSIYGKEHKCDKNAEPLNLKHEQIDIWFGQDRVFLMPRVIVNFMVFIPDFTDTPLKRVSSAVFIEVLIERISAEIGYTATLADVSYSVKVYESIGLRFKFKGYNDKLGQFIVKVM